MPIITQTVAFALALPAVVGVLMLLGWHAHLALMNQSTIEYQEVIPGPGARLDGGMEPGGRYSDYVHTH